MSKRKLDVGNFVKLNISHPKFNGKRLEILGIKYSELYRKNIFMCSIDGSYGSDDNIYYALEKELVLID